MSRVTVDIGGPLEWVAVAHHNTGHPHVHVALTQVRHNTERFRFF
jgi:type IV secretory pathway VirD2 relaxase